MFKGSKKHVYYYQKGHGTFFSSNSFCLMLPMEPNKSRKVQKILTKLPSLPSGCFSSVCDSFSKSGIKGLFKGFFKGFDNSLIVESLDDPSEMSSVFDCSSGREAPFLFNISSCFLIRSTKNIVYKLSNNF